MCSQEKDWDLWRALAERMVAIQDTHSTTLKLSLTVSDGGYRSFVAVEVSVTCPTLIGPARPLRLSMYSHYPHQKHSTLQSLCLEMLSRMEKRINEEVYRQQSLPGF